MLQGSKTRLFILKKATYKLNLELFFHIALRSCSFLVKATNLTESPLFALVKDKRHDDIFCIEQSTIKN